jgi:glucose/arabinose dehydrogenase
MFLVLFISIVTLQTVPAQELQPSQEKPFFRLRVAFPKLQFQDPVGFQYARDGSNRLYVIEKAGIIRVFQNSDSVDSSRVFLDIRSHVVSEGAEQGLLGLAFHPDYARNGYFYVYYNKIDPFRTMIVRYRVGNDNLVDTNSALVILSVERRTNYHNAGQMLFGPDGYLYIGSGEGGQEYAAPVLTSLLGKILRIDVEPGSAGGTYSIPPDNPFAFDTNGNLPEIYSYGMRNPWRFSIDSVTGNLWAADVGPENWEEINIIEKGKNYGWPRMEGMHCYPPKDSGCDTTGLTYPLWEYNHQQGVAIVGGFVYRGSRIPELVGEYIYGDFGYGNIWGLRYDGMGPVTNRLLLEQAPTITSFGLDDSNELYLTSYDGKIYTFDTPLDTSDTSDVTPVECVPSTVTSALIQLIRNEPNPFIASTEIRYTLTRGAHVQLIVHDMLGRVVAIPVDGFQNAGQHRIPFDATNLPAGSYSYTLVAAGTELTRGRMTIVR